MTRSKIDTWLDLLAGADLADCQDDLRFEIEEFMDRPGGGSLGIPSMVNCSNCGTCKHGDQVRRCTSCGKDFCLLCMSLTFEGLKAPEPKLCLACDGVGGAAGHRRWVASRPRAAAGDTK